LAATRLLLLLACTSFAACAAHKPLCEGELRPINVGASATPAHPGARHGD